MAKGETLLWTRTLPRNTAAGAPVPPTPTDERAVYFASRSLLRRKGRRVIVLVTDGVTNVGETAGSAFHKLMKRYDVRVFGFLLIVRT